MSRKLSECVKDGEPIKHTIRSKNKDQSKVWIVIYNKNKDILICGDSVYIGRSPLNQFTENNYKKYRPDRTFSNNAWTECEIYRNNKWISMKDLQKL
tara:strand:- start:207 stop:497 length:291 start_codon:yes stop_codon:yes gene_type:complete